MAQMKISNDGLALIKSFEGLRLKSYRCPAGVWTIGYGHTITAKPGMTITEVEADALLCRDLQHFEKCVSKHIAVPLEQHQFDALVSFCYNVGCGALMKSTLRRKLNAGDYEGAADELLRWNKAGGKELRGLTRRREAERAMFLAIADNDETQDPGDAIANADPAAANSADADPAAGSEEKTA